jgi:anti-sigma factor RsiW
VRHARAHQLLSAYLERDLGEAESAAVEAHVTGCDACGAALDGLRSAVAALRRLPVPEPPPFLAGRVMARIRDGEARRAGWREWLANLAAPAVAAPLAAVVAAAAVVYLAEPPPAEVVTRTEPDSARHLADSAEHLVIEPRLVGPVAPGVLLASGGPNGQVLARRLRGAGHPHSTSLAAHFERPAEAVVVSWQSR